MPSLDNPRSLEKAPQQAESSGPSGALQKRLGTISPPVWVLAGHCCGGTPRAMFSFQGGKLQCTGHSGACVAGQQWRRGLRTVELRDQSKFQLKEIISHKAMSILCLLQICLLGTVGYSNIAVRRSLRFAFCHSWSPLTEHTGPATLCFQDKCALAVPSSLWDAEETDCDGDSHHTQHVHSLQQRGWESRSQLWVQSFLVTFCLHSQTMPYCGVSCRLF